MSTGTRHSFLVFAVCLAFLVCTPARPAEIIIGTGAASWINPLTTSYHDCRTQSIYLASEIGGAYNITALALNVTTPVGQVMNTFTIRMKHTSLSAYSAPVSWESTGWTTVYQANEFVGSTGWKTFTFTTPFSYNGVDNLMVDISFNNSSYTTTGRCTYSTPGGNRSIYYRTNSAYGDPLTWSGTTPTPGVATYIPNVKLYTEGAATPTFTPEGAMYSAPVAVTISCITSGAVIHYTTNGADPTESDPVISSGSTVLVEHSLTLKAKAWRTGMDVSAVKASQFILTVLTPWFSPGDGSYPLPLDATVNCGTPGAMIHYTTNGADPTESDPVVAPGFTVHIDHNLTLKAKAWKEAWEASSVNSVTYLDAVATAAFSPDGGTLSSPESVTVTCATDGATIHYTTNGVDPTESDPVVASGGSVTVNHDLTLKARAWKAGIEPSAVKSAQYRFAAVIHVRPDGNDGADGLTWGTAKRTVEGGIAAAASGDEVWVQAGIYFKGAVLKSGVALYGGFNGTETSLPQRDWAANRTILDGGRGGTPAGGVVFSPSGATTAPRVDGFTIRNGEGGVLCGDSSSSPTIVNNTISGNTGTGVFCNYASSIIANNVIIGNGGGGISCFFSSPVITNNTIIANVSRSCGGIDNYCSGPTISNNIVAFNSSGIHVVTIPGNPGPPHLQNNCVYGNIGYDYAGTLPGLLDMSFDPLLASKEYGNAHIQPGSPCVNAGRNDAPGLQSTDIDLQARIQGDTVDIGADESNGTTWPAGPYMTVRVSPSGDDASDGSTWFLAKRTVQAGINEAAARGGDVWVAAGDYSERITVPQHVFLYGGFGASESSLSQRDWVMNRAVLSGSGSGSVATMLSGLNLNGLDGFTVRGGNAECGGGIRCDFSSPTIANNVISGNSATYGGGIGSYTRLHVAPSRPTVRNNLIIGNTAQYGGGIYGMGVIVNNVIAGNTAQVSGGGIECGADGESVTWQTESIRNNTIVGNTASDGGGMCLRRIFFTLLSIRSNIIAYNSSGIWSNTAQVGPVASNNCVYNPDDYDYSFFSAGPGDFSKDPVFVNQAAGDYHLQAGSPCIDTGTNAGAPTTDLDGFIRPQDGNGDGTAICDIGAYEFPFNPSLARKNYADGVSLAFASAAVTAEFSGLGCVYVENLDRSSGVRVDTSQTLADSTLVNVQGTMQTDSTTGERYVQAFPDWPKPTGGHQALRPLTLTGKSIGGGRNGLQAGVWGKQYVEVPEDGFTLQWVQAEGLNNIGLLVTIFGEVTYADADYFYMDDGSLLDDDSGHIGVKVIGPPPTPDPVGKYVKVTGISTCEKKGSDLVRLIRALEVSEIH